MLRTFVPLGTLVAAFVFAALAGAAGRGDSVVGSVAVADQVVVSVSAHSGPGGENPFGTVELRGLAVGGVRRVEVTCLDVHGNEAGLTGPVVPPIPIQDTGYYVIGVYVIVIDHGPPGSARDELGDGQFTTKNPDQTLPPDTCHTPPLPPPPTTEVDHGNISVADTTP
jgi:hypothetical protein